jgi:uncharacterized membrane protein
MGAPASLVALLQPWADLYSNSKVVSSSVMFVHLGGLLLGGGGAVAADRDTIRNIRTSEAEQSCHLADLRVIHRIVLAGLVVTFLSGLLMLAADIETLLGLTVFWVKMALIVILLANGTIMTRVERTVRPGSPANWARLRAVSAISLFLWFAIVLVSTFLAAA